MSIFSAKNARKAQMATAQILGQAQDQAFGILDQAQQQGMDYLNQNTGVYNTGYQNAYGQINAGYGAANPYYQNAQSYYDPYYQSGNQALSAYQDAMGFNGAEGSARASQAFRATPGYQFALEQGQDAINRTAATRGMASSGNTAVELAKYTTGFADQNYNNYLNNLQGGMQQGMAAAQGMAGINQTMAGNAINQGNALGSLSMAHAGNLAGVNTGLSGLAQGNAATKAQMLMNVAGQNVQATQQAYNAADQANANRFSALMGGLKLGGGFLGLV